MQENKQRVLERKRMRKRKKNNRTPFLLLVLLCLFIGGGVAGIKVLTSDKNVQKTEATAEAVTTQETTTEAPTQEETTTEPPTNDPDKVDPVEYMDATAGVSSFQNTLEAKDAILIDADEKKILFSMNAKERVSPASTTKMMTALTALQFLDPDTRVTVGDEIYLIGEGSSTAQLEKGDVLKVRQLIQGLMLSSGNDAAYVLAVNTARKVMGSDYPIQDSIRSFISMMNRNVDRMKLTDTHFASPDGYDTENQYTTAYDLSMIAYEALQNKVIMDAVSVHSIYVPEIDATWTSTNELTNPDSAYYYEKAIGLKTGSTPNAGKCLVSAAKDGDRTMLCVVMGSGPEGRWTDSKALLEFGFGIEEETATAP